MLAVVDAVVVVVFIAKKKSQPNKLKEDFMLAHTMNESTFHRASNDGIEFPYIHKNMSKLHANEQYMLASIWFTK